MVTNCSYEHSYSKFNKNKNELCSYMILEGMNCLFLMYIDNIFSKINFEGFAINFTYLASNFVLLLLYEFFQRLLT